MPMHIMHCEKQKVFINIYIAYLLVDYNLDHLPHRATPQNLCIYLHQMTFPSSSYVVSLGTHFSFFLLVGHQPMKKKMFTRVAVVVLFK